MTNVKSRKRAWSKILPLPQSRGKFTEVQKKTERGVGVKAGDLPLRRFPRKFDNRTPSLPCSTKDMRHKM